MCHVVMEYLFNESSECKLLILVDVVVVTSYVNVHRCELSGDDGRDTGVQYVYRCVDGWETIVFEIRKQATNPL